MKIPTTSMWADQELRSTAPRYATPDLCPKRSDLLDLGFAAETIEYLYPNPNTNAMLVDPSEWFWTDRKWFKGASERILDDISRISGGFFSDLALSDQAEILGVPLTTITGRRLPEIRGKWRSASGSPVDVEQYGLEALLQPGESGTWNEGKSRQGFEVLTRKTFERLNNGQWLGFDETNRMPYTPSGEYTERVLAAARVVLEDPRAAYRQHPPYFDTLMNAPMDQVENFIDIVGHEHILRVTEHRYAHNARIMSGHPDVTIGGPNLRFAEIKHKDRLHGNQAMWIRNIAIPLGMSVQIVRVSG